MMAVSIAAVSDRRGGRSQIEAAAKEAKRARRNQNAARQCGALSQTAIALMLYVRFYLIAVAVSNRRRNLLGGMRKHYDLECSTSQNCAATFRFACAFRHLIHDRPVIAQ